MTLRYLKTTFVIMRGNMDMSLAKFLMILSMIFLGVLEYLWLHNEYEDKYRVMEDELNHVLLSSMRDVEDSLIFSKIAPEQLKAFRRGEKLDVNINIRGNDTVEVMAIDTTGVQHYTYSAPKIHTRGLLLKSLSGDTTLFDTPPVALTGLIMRHIRLADSTGDYAGFQLLTWENGDTMISEITSHPQVDVIAGKKMALSNPRYKSELLHDLIPHMSFAAFLWLMVGAAFYYIWRNLQRQMQLNALRDEFVSNITHELKTPITTVGVALESLHFAEDLQGAQSRRYLDICQSELKRLSMLVERILHNKSPQIHYEKMDMKLVLEDVMHHMKVQFDNKQAVINVRLKGDEFMIRGDRSHLSSVLYNLLENALKYSPSQPEITVEMENKGDHVALHIIDKGIGIDPGYHDKIFEKLYRVPQHNRHDVKGHGLGLSYVADVVRKHQGQIDLESEPGKGSTFILNFPAFHEN